MRDRHFFPLVSGRYPCTSTGRDGFPARRDRFNSWESATSGFMLGFLQNLRMALPAIVLVTSIVIGLGSGYYFASADRQTRVTWDRNPLIVTFSSQTGSGSARDSFTCSNRVAPVVLEAFSNQPSVVSLTVSPSAFSSCGSTVDSVVVTASCTASDSAHACPGDSAGKVLVCGPTSYTCQERSLIVIISRHDHNNGRNNQDKH